MQSPLIELDEFDRKILDILQANNKMPQREIAKAVHLSAPAIQRRIKKMEDFGIIQCNIALLDPTKFDQRITIITQVSMESERLDLYESAKTSFHAAPEVQQCYYVTGDADFILIITVKTMRDYERLTRELFFENNNVKSFRTFVAMEPIKTGLAIPTS
ncbi:Lrp/AsnC family transcriptional regulator [Bartonella sp. HY761]|uniref:Lrp/AsnC family transcriptional regulator n=1 Tax=Bartonella sp. HY761 TaxID=2979330 RepID=UPI0021E2ADA8|nr:Lrp/AsnC family transcriptional regulator [Bartonella sp. HY761]UXN07935.1 Lrp/AsnC family transcriptional regulator [Bartonella sp. HY761]